MAEKQRINPFLLKSIMEFVGPKQQSKMTPSAYFPKGLLTPGNINLSTQPVVNNPEHPGMTSTVDSISYNIGGREVLLPRVTPGGKYLKTKKAILDYYDATHKHLGIFDKPENATKYAQQLHEDYELGLIKVITDRLFNVK